MGIYFDSHIYAVRIWYIDETGAEIHKEVSTELMDNPRAAESEKEALEGAYMALGLNKDTKILVTDFLKRMMFSNDVKPASCMQWMKNGEDM